LENHWTKLTGKYQQLPEILTSTDNEKWEKWKNEFLENFGYGLSNVIDILDPDAIV